MMAYWVTWWAWRCPCGAENWWWERICAACGNPRRDGLRSRWRRG